MIIYQSFRSRDKNPDGTLTCMKIFSKSQTHLSPSLSLHSWQKLAKTNLSRRIVWESHLTNTKDSRQLDDQKGYDIHSSSYVFPAESVVSLSTFKMTSMRGSSFVRISWMVCHDASLSYRTYLFSSALILQGIMCFLLVVLFIDSQNKLVSRSCTSTLLHSIDGKVVVWLFIDTNKKVNGLPLCPIWLTKKVGLQLQLQLQETDRLSTQCDLFVDKGVN